MSITNPQVLQAMGRVAAQASIFEQSLHFAYWHYAGIKRTIGPLITGRMIPKRVFEDLIKIARKAKAANGRIDDLKNIQSIYGGLAEQRNEVLHWIWYSDASDKEHRIFAPGYMPGKETHSKPYTAKQINKIAGELRELARRMNAHTVSDDTLTVAHQHGHMTDVPSPWLGTLPSPSPKRRKSPRGRK
jgi:hypothetical protein